MERRPRNHEAAYAPRLAYIVQHLRDLSVTEVCFAVGCSSLGTFSTRFTELVGVPLSFYWRQAARAKSVAAAWWPPSQVTRPIRNREARVRSRK